MVENVLREVVSELSGLPFVEGIVLGGSRATGMATESSDIDVGIYYDSHLIEFRQLNLIAKKLDDERRENLICSEGEWGNWVNCGGWLTVQGYDVDLILRDIKRVEACVEQTDAGDISMHYQTGHPHAYFNVMYRGELASSKVLYGNEKLKRLKERAECYPEKLKSALLSFFMFEAKFSCTLAKNYMNKEDIYYGIGHMFRSVSALNQVIFALNEIYCLNEKKALKRIKSFPVSPYNYSERANQALILNEENMMEHIEMIEQLCCEAEDLLNQQIRAY